MHQTLYTNFSTPKANYKHFLKFVSQNFYKKFVFRNAAYMVINFLGSRYLYLNPTHFFWKFTD